MTSLRYAVVGIFGPTATGKSDVAHALALRLGSEVVSADAYQVYEGIPVVTNQPPWPTRLTAIRAVSQEMSVGQYAALAHAEIDDLVTAKGVAIVAGGTGLYFRAALADLDIPTAVAPEARARLEREYDRDPAAAYAVLQGMDPAAAAVVHPNDRRRVVRSLELAEQGGSLVPARDGLWSETYRHDTLVVGLDLAEPVLRRRIHDRTAAMIRRGARAEANAALEAGVSRTAAKALGLSELATLAPDEAAERIEVRTRRYAAYQRKWMRRIPGIELIDADRPTEEVVDAVLHLVRGR